MNLSEIMTKSNDELVRIATEFGASENGSNKRHELVTRVAKAVAEKEGPITAAGILSIVNDGYGFLRQEAGNSSASDVYVSQSQIRRFGLRTGDQMVGRVRPPKDGERYFGLVRVEQVNGVKPDSARNRPKFESFDSDIPNRATEARDDSPKPLHPPHRPSRANRARTARPYRFTSKGRQDLHPEGHCRRHHRKPPGRAHHGCADRRAA